MTDDAPGRWQWAGGEAGRPLHEGGYYLHIATLTVWENQYGREYYECIVDTANYGPNAGPTEHVMEINLRRVDKQAGDSWDLERKAHDTADVEGRNDPEAQKRAEEEIHKLATMHMEYYTHD